MKKFFAYLFLVLAIILTLASLFQLPNLFSLLGQLFADQSDAYEAGKVVGGLIGWLLQLGLAVVFWIFGLRWMRQSPK